MAHRKSEMRYLRRDGNRMVRARRRRRTALRMTLMTLLWVAAALGAMLAIAAVERWATSPQHFRLAHVLVRGNQEVREEEVVRLTSEWMGKNILVLTLADVERKVREHPWIGSTGALRIQRRLPGSLVVTVGERKAAGLGLLGGIVWLLDENGMPIDRFAPRYSERDFPIIKGLDALRADETRLQRALKAGVAVTRVLASEQPAFFAQVSEIDVSEPDMIVVRLEDESYDLRLSRENHLQNLENYFALRDHISDDETGAIEYVDLRWQGRIAVMPAAAQASASAADIRRRAKRNGGR